MTRRKLLDQLTDAQLGRLSAMMPTYRQSLSTTALVDRDRVTGLLRGLYKRKPPVTFMYSIPMMLASIYKHFDSSGANLRWEASRLPLLPVGQGSRSFSAGELWDYLTEVFTGGDRGKTKPKATWDGMWAVQNALAPVRNLFETYRNMHLLMARPKSAAEGHLNRRQAANALQRGSSWMSEIVTAAGFQQLGYRTEIEPLDSLIALSLESPCVALFADRCWVLDRPARLVLNDRDQISCTTGPAVTTRDGFEMYAVHGIRIAKYMITDPGRIKVADIEQERNIEVRRVMVDLYGMERYLRDTNAVVVDDDPQIGTLYHKTQPWPDETIAVVKVRNSTPEPDGHYKDYFLRVPPTIRSARAGVAWTFKVHPSRYNPQLET